ncbi:hypothetical protein V1499_04980 [Neobacillus sp. SCS-31]
MSIQHVIYARMAARHNGKLLPANWEDTYSLLAGKVKETLAKKGPGGLPL